MEVCQRSAASHAVKFIKVLKVILKKVDLLLLELLAAAQAKRNYYNLK